MVGFPQSKLLIFVPAGAEARAVQQGLATDQSSALQVITIPIGVTARTLVQSLLDDNTLSPGQTCLLMGLGGGLSPRFKLGDGILCQTCLALDAAGTATAYETDSVLNDWIMACLPDLARGVGITCDHIIASTTEKQQIHHRYRADVVDMEAAWLLDLLQPHAINLAVLRVISDPHHQPLPNLAPALQANGQLHPGRLISQLVKQPLAASHLIYGSVTGLARLKRLTRTLVNCISQPKI